MSAEVLEAMRKQVQFYAEQRDNHAQEANRLSAAADTHRVASHQFAGAHDAAVAMIAMLEKPATPEVNGNGQ